MKSRCGIHRLSYAPQANAKTAIVESKPKPPDTWDLTGAGALAAKTVEVANAAPAAPAPVSVSYYRFPELRRHDQRNLRRVLELQSRTQQRPEEMG